MWKHRKQGKSLFKVAAERTRSNTTILFIHTTSDSKLIIVVFQDLPIDKIIAWGQGEFCALPTIYYFFQQENN